jgi:hypothetical protein
MDMFQRVLAAAPLKFPISASKLSDKAHCLCQWESFRSSGPQ